MKPSLSYSIFNSEQNFVLMQLLDSIIATFGIPEVNSILIGKQVYVKMNISSLTTSGNLRKRKFGPFR